MSFQQPDWEEYLPKASGYQFEIGCTGCRDAHTALCTDDSAFQDSVQLLREADVPYGWQDDVITGGAGAGTCDLRSTLPPEARPLVACPNETAIAFVAAVMMDLPDTVIVRTHLNI